MTGFISYVDENCNFNPNPFLVTARRNDENKEKRNNLKNGEESARLIVKNDTHFVRKDDWERENQAKAACRNRVLKRYEGLKERNVFERLTDHRFYTGIHKERFDEHGRGRGLAGRENLSLFDGNTESFSRAHQVYSSVLPRSSCCLRQSRLERFQKFKLQVATPKIMWLYRNGDKHHDGLAFYLRPFVRTMDILLLEIGKELTLIAGPVRRIYDQNLRRVTDVSEIVDGAKYLCTSGEPPTSPDRLEKFLSEWVIQKMF